MKWPLPKIKDPGLMLLAFALAIIIYYVIKNESVDTGGKQHEQKLFQRD